MNYPRSGAIVPHAAVLLSEVAAGALSREVAELRARARAVVGARPPGPVVLVSSRAGAPGRFREARGDLVRAGVPALEVACARDEALASALDEVWPAPPVDGAWDEALTVAASLSGLKDRPLIAVRVGEAPDDVEALAAALRSLADPPHVVVCAHSGAGITQRSPLTQLPGGEDVEKEMARAIQRDAGWLTEGAWRLRTDGGSSGASGLALFGHLFAGRPATIHAHRWPFGVGYLVASVCDA